MSEVLSAVRAICEDGLAREGRLADGLRQALDALEDPGELRPGAPQDLEVVERHLDTCLGLAGEPAAARLVGSLSTEPEVVPWRPSMAYGGEPAMEDFLRRYAVAVFLGPDRFGLRCPYLCTDATLGVTLQAPETDYPAHGHAAVEIYYILAGSADWQQGDGVWRRKVPGGFVLHEAHEPHAMRTRDEPLLAMFAWVSDLMSDVYLAEAV